MTPNIDANRNRGCWEEDPESRVSRSTDEPREAWSYVSPAIGIHSAATRETSPGVP